MQPRRGHGSDTRFGNDARGSRFRVPIWIAILGVLAACAIQDPPPGGPEDRKPPLVTSTVPTADSAGVAPDAEIRIQFDEDMKKDRVERNIVFYPNIVIRDAGWDGNTLVIRPEALHPDTTYIIVITPGYRDAHGVAAEEEIRFAFATSTAIDSGVVEGRVYFRRKPSDRAMVRLFSLPKDSAFVAQAARPDREVRASPDGSYSFERLPTADARFLVWAFHDANANGRFDTQNEVGAVLADTVLLRPSTPTSSDHAVYIVDPTEPAELTGRIINATGVDTFPVSVSLEALPDTTDEPSQYTRCDAEGNYQLKPLRGTYILRAFMDFRVDRVCGEYICGADTTVLCVEPCAVYPDTIRVDPGQTLRIEDLTLGPAPPRSEP
jgi:hypothetical protein